MATATRAAKKQVNGIENLFTAPGCSGGCYYIFDPGTGTYVLDRSKSSCTGDGCAGCSTTMPSVLSELVKEAGPCVFPDPHNLALSCGAHKEIIIERLLTSYVDCLRLQKHSSSRGIAAPGWASCRRGCSAAFFTSCSGEVRFINDRQRCLSIQVGYGRSRDGRRRILALRCDPLPRPAAELPAQRHPVRNAHRSAQMPGFPRIRRPLAAW